MSAERQLFVNSKGAVVSSADPCFVEIRFA